MIFVMGITMLKMDRGGIFLSLLCLTLNSPAHFFPAKAKWRIKLQNAFDGKRMYINTRSSEVKFLLN